MLGFTNVAASMGNIAGTYNTATGVMTLTSSGNTATLAQWQAALQAVTYSNSSDNPSTSARTISYVVNDGTTNSNAVTNTVNLTAVNDAPTLAGTPTALAYTENGAAAAIHTAITVTDLDNTTLASATVSITGNFANGQDVLGFTNVAATMGNIAGTYNATTGVMTLTSAGNTATLAQWQTALRAVSYSNSSDNPSTSARTISYVVNDGTTNSNAVTNTVNLTAVNDAPSITTPATAPGASAGAAYSLPTGFRVADVDAGTNPVQVTFKVAEGSNTVGDTLSYTPGTGVTLFGSPDTNKVYTFQGTLTDLNNWMNTPGFLKFTPSAGFTGNASIITSVNDLGNTGGAALTTNGTPLTVSVVNDNTKPTITAPTTPFSYNENWNVNQNPFPAAQVVASDNIAVTQYRFSDASGTAIGTTTSDGYFTISANGKITMVSTITTNAPVNDFESGPNSWSYYVQAGDAANNWSTPVQFTLNELDVATEPVISGYSNHDGTTASGSANVSRCVPPVVSTVPTDLSAVAEVALAGMALRISVDMADS